MWKDLHFLRLKVFQTCLLHNISLEIQWIPRSEFQRADYINRLIDTDDWQISTQFFELLEELWGPHSLDCFGTRVVQELIILYNLSVTKIAWLLRQYV